MKNYELTYLISPDLSSEKLKSLSFKVSDFILEEQGNIKETSEPIKKRLGPVIEKKNEAFLVSLTFNFDPEKLTILNRKLKEEKNIIRYTIINKKERAKVLAPRRIFKQEILQPETVKSEFPKIEEAKITDQKTKSPKNEKKVELKEIDEKIEEILKE